MAHETLVLHAHPLEQSYSAALRDAVCGALTSRGLSHSLVKLQDGQRPDLRGGDYRHLVAVYPTWWGGPPAVLLDWLQRSAVDASGFQQLALVTVVTTHGSSKLVNSLQGEPGRQTWSRVVIHRCAREARFEWLSLYKIDRTTEAERGAFIEQVRDHFTTVRLPL